MRYHKKIGAKSIFILSLAILDVCLLYIYFPNYLIIKRIYSVDFIFVILLLYVFILEFSSSLISSLQLFITITKTTSFITGGHNSDKSLYSVFV